MSEALTALVTAILMFVAAEIRKRSKKQRISTNPPPPDQSICKQCFFFREFKRGLDDKRDSDTTILRRYQ